MQHIQTCACPAVIFRSAAIFIRQAFGLRHEKEQTNVRAKKRHKYTQQTLQPWCAHLIYSLKRQYEINDIVYGIYVLHRALLYAKWSVVLFMIYLSVIYPLLLAYNIYFIRYYDYYALARGKAMSII